MIYENGKVFIEEVTEIAPIYKLMGIDMGERKIGVAFATSDLKISTPYKTIERKNLKADIAAIISVAEDNGVHGIVFGLPLEMTGEEGETAKRVKGFIGKLLRKTDLPITFQDERMSTALANQILIQTGVSRKRRVDLDDQISANLILDSFISKYV